ncbi:MAG: DNA polymerase III subunit delta [Endomicrobium sp.]|jgi:DNA polymerase-3 subunit delta|nr:DNA polymerase III subunit delta [Endomicrobium sp.]
MTIIKIQDFDKLISAKKVSPVYMFAGEESYLIDLCLEKTEKLIAADDLNKEIFYAGEMSSEDVFNALQTLPFLSERRVIIVKGANKMKADDAQRFADYVSNPIETSSLIFIYNGAYKKETVAKRKELISACSSSKFCVFADCRKQYESETRDFIKKEFAKRGKNVSYDVIARILDDSGTSLLNISQEIEKLSLFVGKDKKNITLEDLELISGYDKETNVYALSSHLESRDVKKALFVLEKLISEGEEPVIILSAISSAIRKMLNAKSMLEERGMGESETASALRIHNYFAGAFFDNLKKRSLAKLKNDMKSVLKADIAIKTGSSDAFSAFEKVILFVCKP